MATVVTLPLKLTTPPGGYSKPSVSKPSAPSSLPLYPAGPSFISAARREILQRTFEQDDAEITASREAAKAAQQDASDGNPFPGLGEEEEDSHVLAQDPKEWKKQDHYAVLGLGHLRYKASEDHIRVAHRRKVLRHHPDKKAAAKGANDDSFFKCIQKAHETLTHSERRKQFDSVDWNIEDEIPDFKDLASNPDEFCKIATQVFAREGRFSKVQPVPEFGDANSSKKEVEGFYDFFYNFDSWRSFEWHDKEVNEGSDSRDDKRFTEKKNKSERTRRKKEDNTRLRTLVDTVLAVDPRIKRIKAEEKAARDAKKKGVANGGPAKPLTPAEKKKLEDEKKKAEEAKKAEEKKANEASKGEREAAKKAKEAARKNLKKWKKAVSTVIASSNYFLPAGTAPSASTIEKQLAELDLLVDILEPEDVKDLKEKVEKAGSGEPAKAAIKEKVASVQSKPEAEGKFSEFA
ncbi:hypothetical protein CI109_104948 [Kwoniella shandongensis]|uniref:Uncharacterized protein n=1 Tax=Kwoniella shandongensis TaxID=1734106 RepID=A0A5M6BTQ6_9TREE|nr:uncharacterized protein CI109_007275 [Kwoniella shandongensis]KAA5524399.1 hypothetical protein CI109_007275 [Kwoniella shandongensis]